VTVIHDEVVSLLRGSQSAEKQYAVSQEAGSNMLAYYRIQGIISMLNGVYPVVIRDLFS
jgi:hypothetical protein